MPPVKVPNVILLCVDRVVVKCTARGRAPEGDRKTTLLVVVLPTSVVDANRTCAAAAPSSQLKAPCPQLKAQDTRL
jgi:hypothetical protein